jgi:hypothetical protein
MTPSVNPTYNQTNFFDLHQARWTSRVLAMLIAVVGQESLLGLILGQTRREILSLVQAEAEGAAPAPENWHLSN